MHLHFLINAVKSWPKINAKGAKERKKTKEVEIFLKTKKTNRPLMSDSSQPGQGKIKHLPSKLVEKLGADPISRRSYTRNGGCKRRENGMAV